MLWNMQSFYLHSTTHGRFLKTSISANPGLNRLTQD